MKIYNDNSLINVSNSILKHYGVKTFHDTCPVVDKALENHRKVVVCLFDGMGKNIVRKHLKEDSFIRSHYLTTINSTCPPTTVAATNAFLSGRYPIETGWVSWAQYFEEYNRNIILFRNKDYNTCEIIRDPKDSIADEYYHYDSILDLIKANNPNTDVVDMKRYPITLEGPKSLRDGKKKLNRRLKKSNDCFIYFYIDIPDFYMHATGIDSKITHRTMLKIDKFMKKVANKNKDTLFIVLADHGHINVEYRDICDHQDLYECLRQPLSFEKRTTTFFVKEDKKETFVELFNKYYGDIFELMTREDALNNHLFGLGEPHPHILKSVGDYIAVAKDKYAIFASKEMTDYELFKGHHAGGTEDERLIDIAVINS